VDGSAVDDSGAGPAGRADLTLRVLGALVAVAGALVTAVIEVFLAPLRAGTVRVPVSLLLAVAGNLALVWYTYRVTGKRAAVALPALVWVVVMVRASGRTAEGDLLLTGDNWVGLLTILGGTVAFAGGAYFLIVPRRQLLSHPPSQPARTPPRRT
jgi:Family of unknown function (DUF6113)